MQFLVEHGADVDLAAADTGETPLHSALCKPNRPADERVVKVLLANGADAKDRNGDSPLTWVSWHLRPAGVLRKLCYGDFYVRPDYAGMEAHLLGEPHTEAKAP